MNNKPKLIQIHAETLLHFFAGLSTPYTQRFACEMLGEKNELGDAAIKTLTKSISRLQIHGENEKQFRKLLNNDEVLAKVRQGKPLENISLEFSIYVELRA